MVAARAACAGRCCRPLRRCARPACAGAAARRAAGWRRHVAHWQCAARAAPRRRTHACCSKDTSLRCRRATAPSCTSMPRCASWTARSARRALRRARLAWRDAPSVPRVGERWRLLVRLAPLARHAQFRGRRSRRASRFAIACICAARVLPSALNARLALAPTSIDTLRARIAARIARCGRRSGCRGAAHRAGGGPHRRHEHRSMARVQRHGTTHLVAISGLHVTLFALLAFCAGARCVALAAVARGAVDREPFAVLLGLRPRALMRCSPGSRCPRSAPGSCSRCSSAARLAARARGRGAHLVAGADRRAAARSLRAAVGGLLAVVRGGGRDPAASRPRSLVRARSRTRCDAVRLQLAVMLALAPLTFAVFGGVSLAGLWVNLRGDSPDLVRARAAGAGRRAGGAGGAGLRRHAVRAAATLYEWLWPALVWAADCDLALWRVDAAAVVVSRWRCRRRCCCCGAGRWRCALTAAGVVLPLLFAPSRLPDAGHGARRACSTPGAARRCWSPHIRTCCCSTPATAGTRTARALRAARAAGARRAGTRAPSTCWCCQRSTPIAHRARRC